MFNNTKQLKEQLAKAEEALQAAQRLNANLVEAFAETATLIDIRVNGNTNVFTMQRNGQVFYINTYSTMSDDVKGWKENAGIV